MNKIYLMICNGLHCIEKGIKDIEKEFIRVIKENNLTEKIKIIESGCLGYCESAPAVYIYTDNVLYGNLKITDVERIVKEHFINGYIVKDLVVSKGKIANRFFRIYGDAAFFSKQLRLTLRNCGVIDPENIEEYISVDGYAALAKVLTNMTPDDVINEVKKSGLRGRGGGGFSTGLKWDITKKSSGKKKFVICNADEGDPGAFMDRSAIEGDPFTILEGMTIAAYAIGARQGYVYIRAEYPLAIKRLNIAIEQAKKMNLLGNNIFGSEFSFDIELRLGAGAFVCGEETALIHSIEGKRGMPTPRPPYPSVKGLWGYPTLINNVETFANIPVVIYDGAEWFSRLGTEKSKGTKVFAVAGKVNNTGLVEIPMGTTLREIIYDIGGGIKDGKKFKAAQTGGPSGGCLPEKYLDTPIDYENLLAAGSMMGSGGLIVMDEDTCMVDVAKFFLDFTQSESCGKCTPCREGTKRMLEILTRITEGKGKPEDIKKLKRLSETIKMSSLCGLGQSAPNPVLSTLNNFLDEYEAHINEKRCPAGVCKALLKYSIISDKCVGCTLCSKKCPVNAISGKVKTPHVIDQEKCISCGECYDACKFGAIVRK